MKVYEYIEARDKVFETEVFTLLIIEAGFPPERADQFVMRAFDLAKREWQRDEATNITAKLKEIDIPVAEESAGLQYRANA